LSVVCISQLCLTATTAVNSGFHRKGYLPNTLYSRYAMTSKG